MSDQTPDVLDALMQQADERYPLNIGHVSRDIYLYKCEQVLRDLATAGYVVVLDPSGTLHHGDELVHVRGRAPGDDGWRRVERSEPEPSAVIATVTTSDGRKRDFEVRREPEQPARVLCAECLIMHSSGDDNYLCPGFTPVPGMTREEAKALSPGSRQAIRAHLAAGSGVPEANRSTTGEATRDD